MRRVGFLLPMLLVACGDGPLGPGGGHFDTHPASDAPTFDGAWSNYPFFGDDVIAVSSISDGLFLL